MTFGLVLMVLFGFGGGGVKGPDKETLQLHVVLDYLGLVSLFSHLILHFSNHKITTHLSRIKTALLLCHLCFNGWMDE